MKVSELKVTSGTDLFQPPLNEEHDIMSRQGLGNVESEWETLSHGRSGKAFMQGG